MRFVYPWVLAFLPAVLIIAALACWLLVRGGKRLDMFMSRELRERLVHRASSRAEGLQIALVSVSLLLLIVAAARPQWGRSEMKVVTRGRNLLIALDVSRSMLAADVHPNRLERARVDIMDLIGDLKGDRAGILVFRGKANMICPLTTDKSFLRQALDGITIDSAPRGETDLADAITKSIAAFSTMPDENNAIILISDGEDLAGRAAAAAAKAGEFGIPIFTVGIGDPNGADVPAADGNGIMRYQGKNVKSCMTESTLSAIASASGGSYIPLATSSTAHTTLGAIYSQHLSRIAAKEMEETLERRLVERYQLFLIPALVLLTLAGAFSRGRLASSVRRAAAVFAFILATQSVLADGTNSAAAVPSPNSCVATARRAQSLFKAGDWTNSASLFLQAINGQDDREAAARYRFNAGLASFNAGDMSAASETLYPIIALPGFGGAAELYGAAQFKLAADSIASTNYVAKASALENSAIGFLHALRANPADACTARNLSRATANIPAVREAAHLEEVLSRYAQTPPQQLINQMLQTERKLMKEAVNVSTNPAVATMIEGFESLSKQQKDNADLWIPLKQQIVNSGAITNEEMRAQVATEIERARDAMKRGADLLADISPDAYDPMAKSENTIYAFWTMMAEPPALIDEDIAVQTNAYLTPSVPRYPTRPDWEDALSLSKMFSVRFPEWAEQVIQQRQGDTNAPPFTAEDAAKIKEYTEQLLWIQNDAVKKEKTEERRSAALEALSLLEKIRDLLPKNPNNQQQPPPQQQQQQQQQQQNENQQQDQQDQQDQNQNQQSEDQQQQQQQESGEKPDTPQDVQEALRRAIQREKEHEQDKQRQMRNYPMPTGARDW